MRRENRKLTFKKANLATWGKEEVDSDDKEEKDEEALLYLMTFNDEVNKVLDLILSCSNNDSDDINDLYHELYDLLVSTKKEL